MDAAMAAWIGALGAVIGGLITGVATQWTAGWLWRREKKDRAGERLEESVEEAARCGHTLWFALTRSPEQFSFPQAEGELWFTVCGMALSRAWRVDQAFAETVQARYLALSARLDEVMNKWPKHERLNEPDEVSEPLAILRGEVRDLNRELAGWLASHS